MWGFVAAAHVGDLIDTLDADATGQGPAIQATFGLLLPDGDAYDWVCHEAVTAPGALTSPSYAPREGRLTSWMPDLGLARDGIGVWTSADGCEWTPATGLDGRVVAEVSHRADGTTWAGTANGADDGLYRSEDGLAFALARAVPGRVLSVRADGPAIWAISAEGDEALTVWHSPDGLAFTGSPLAVPAGLTPPIRARIGAIHPEDPLQAWIVLDPIGTDRVLHTADGGQSALEIWDAPDRVTDLDRGPDGAIYAVLNDRRPWRALPGGPFEDLVGLADGSGLTASSGTLWLANRTFVNHLLLTESADGSTATRTVGPDAIRGPRSCPVGSTAATVCDPLWPLLEPRVRAPADTGDTSPPPPPADTGAPPDPARPACGCEVPSNAGFGGLLAGLLAAVARARRGRPSPEDKR